MCDKQQYSSKVEAITAIHNIAKRKGQAFKTYQCDDCGFIHITSVKTDRLERPKKDRKYKPDYSREITEARKSKSEKKLKKNSKGKWI